MKASHYNVFFPFDEKYILFNTLKGSIFVVDSETRDSLEKNDLSSLNEEFIRLFVKNEIVVEDELNEQEVYRLLYERSKYVLPVTSVDVVTTYACNLACIYCYEGKGELENKSMDERTARCALKFIYRLATHENNTGLRVTLFGGEPLLNMPVNLILAKESRKWCEENSKDFFMSAVTNGTLFTERNVEDLAQYSCSFLVVVDGPHKIHDQRRIYKSGNGTFNDIIDGLHRVTDHGLKIKIRINMDETNKDHIVPFFAFLREEGLTDVSLNITPVFNTSPACSSYSYCMPDLEGSVVTNHLYNVAESMGITTEKKEKPSPQGACRAQRFSNFIIDPYLRLFKCNILLPFEKNAVGTINPEDSEPMFNRVNVDFMSRDPLAADECRMCKLVPVCRGGCLVEILETQGTTHGYICRKQAVHEVLQERLTTFVRKMKAKNEKAQSQE